MVNVDMKISPMKSIPLVIFIITLCFAPLAFGSVEVWSITAVEALVFIVSFTFLLANAKENNGRMVNIPGLLPLILLLCWMIIQIIPLPVFLVKVLSPQSFHAYKPLLDVLGTDVWIPLTVNQKATTTELLRFVTYAVFYIFAIQLLTSGERLRRVVTSVVGLGVVVSFVAILQSFTSPGEFYWFRQVPVNAESFGPWINRSQYCGFIGMVFPLALALFLFYSPNVSSEDSLRSKIVTFFTMPNGNMYLLLTFGVGIMFASVFLSLSRGGVLSLIVASLTFLMLFSLRNRKRSRLFILATACFLVLVVGWFGIGPLLERFDNLLLEAGAATTGRYGRLFVWLDTLNIIRDFPLTGSGFATFLNIYPSYRTVSGTGKFEHAHNDYLELLSDGGVIGFGLVAWFVIVIVLHGWHQIWRRRDNFAVFVSIGALSGIIALLTHSITDFNMHNMAVGLYFFFICALLVSAGNTRFHYSSHSTLLPKASSAGKYTFFLLSLLLLSGVIAIKGGDIVASRSYGQVKDVYLSKYLAKEKLEEVAVATRKAAQLDPLDSLYPAVLGSIAEYQGNPHKSLAYFLQAARRSPMEGVFLHQIGVAITSSDRALAGELMELGYRRTIDKDNLLLGWAEWLLWQGERQQGIAVLQQGIAENNILVNLATTLFYKYSFSQEEITQILPDSLTAWVDYAFFLKLMGEVETSQYYFMKSLDFLETSAVSEAHYFQRLHHFLKQQQDERALYILRKGIELLPDSPELHVTLGDHYMQEGIYYRAREEYEQALILQPGNEGIYMRLEKVRVRE